jgi:hypothetical protein
MSALGRPPRSSSSSRKSISIRVTTEEHELLTKAAHPMYISDWLRRLALEKVAEPTPPAPPPIPSGEVLARMQSIFAPMIEATADDAKRAAITTLTNQLASYCETLVQQAQNATQHSDAMDEVNKDMWQLLYKFASYIKHDAGCPEYPCSCSIQPIAVEVGTALAMAKSPR